MPNWKKVLQHGKDAELNNLYLTGSLEATSLTGSLDWSNLDNAPSGINTGSALDNEVLFWKDGGITGSQNLYWDGSQLGIGTNTPDAGLDFYRSHAGVYDYLKFGSEKIEFTFSDGASAGGAGSIRCKGLDNAYATYLVGDGVNDTGVQPMFRISGRINNALVNTRPLFDIANVNSPKLTVLADGETGIGTSSPSQRLHISGSLRIEDGGIYDKNNANGTSGQILQSDGSAIEWINQSSITAGTASYVDWPNIDNVPTYDNYQYWNLKTNGTQRKQIQSTNDVDFKAGTDIIINYGAGGQVLISSSFTESDTLDDVTGRGNSTSNDISVGSVTSSADIIADGNLEVKGGSVSFQGDASADLLFSLSGDPNNFDDFIQIGDVNNVGNGQLFSIDGDSSEFLFQNGDVIASSSLRINGSLRTYTNNSGNSGDVLTSTGTKIDWTSPTNLTVGNALTASYTENAVSASYVENAQTASYVENATSASYAATASHTPPNWIFEWHDNDPVAGASYTVQFGNTISWQAGPGIKMSSTSPNSGTGSGVLIEVEDDTANGLTHELTGSLGTSLGDYDPKGFVEYAGIATTGTLGTGRVNANAAGQWKISSTSLIYNKHLAMGTSDTKVLARGIIVATGSFSGVGAGDPLFLGDNGVALGSAPTGSGEYVRIIGYLVDGITTDKAYIYFDPSNDWVEVA